MIKALHISSECYPAAKAGGMGDVVGSLPIYLHQAGVSASVVIPKYHNKWFAKESFSPIAKGKFTLGAEKINYKVEKLVSTNLGFPLYCIDIPGKFDRAQVYLGKDGNAFPDEAERNLSFQIAVLEWLKKGSQTFDVFHCHDHMTGLITFMIKYVKRYEVFKQTPTFFTIHNGQYRGVWDWEKGNLLPKFDNKYRGMLDWDKEINCLATAIKCAWRVNTVSPSYMEELVEDLGSLTPLIKDEKGKSLGILNGIDDKVWNPASDKLLDVHLKNEDWDGFKKDSKKKLCKKVKLGQKKVLLSFIGRFAYEKGADLLAPAIDQYLKREDDVNFMILGSGDSRIEEEVLALAQKYPKNVACSIAYDEKLARAIYAGSDFLIMPSRFEPCGLNQMFSMRYGTIPVVRSIGGLIDTVPDVKEGGNGIAFKDATIIDILMALTRVSKLYTDKKKFIALRNKIVKLDFSWDRSAQEYAGLYRALTKE